MRAMSCPPLVIVDDFDVGGPAVALRPFETDPPLIIDSDAVLTLPISAQHFEPVAGQPGEISYAVFCLKKKNITHDRSTLRRVKIHISTNNLVAMHTKIQNLYSQRHNANLVH